MDVRQVAFHFDLSDLRREAEAAAARFGRSDEGQARAMAYLSSPEVVERREQFFAHRRRAIRQSRAISR
ncbi:MAG TPA: hypothetical protein VIE16_10690 [Phenylobacterium sp.]